MRDIQTYVGTYKLLLQFYVPAKFKILILNFLRG
jgi:hypothetical protein